LLRPGVSPGLQNAEIETLRGEFTDTVMMRGYDRVASRFTPGTANRKLHYPVTLGHQHRTRA
jgi:hypothetical protein